MNKKNITFFLIFCLQPAVVAMDQSNNQSTTAVDFNKIINNISNTINKKYNARFTHAEIPIADQRFLFAFSPAPTENDCFDIITTINQCYPSIIINETIITSLATTNNHFKHAVNYFITLAHKNFENVTCKNLNTVANVREKQPTEPLNYLSLPIKEYVMQQAFNTIAHTYTMQLSNQNNGSITEFAICDNAHLAALNNPQQHILELWDLTTIKIIDRVLIPNTDRIEQLCFHPSGSQLAATIARNNSNTCSYLTNIWKLQSAKLEPMDIIQHILPVTNIEYIQQPTVNSYTITTLLSNANLLLWSMDSGKAENSGIIRLPITQLMRCMPHNGQRYEAAHPLRQLVTSTLYVTKKNCPNLYLCKQAIANSDGALTLFNIKQTIPYAQLTDYEKITILALAKHKTERLRIAQTPQNAPTKKFTKKQYYYKEAHPVDPL